jgi:DNA adenine methylase
MALQTAISKPIFPWMGGKTRLAKHIIPMMPDHTCYLELFAGAAAIFVKKEPSKAEVLNDINGDLVNLYRVVRHHLDEFVHQFQYSLASRQMFQWAKDTQPDTLTDIQRAARFLYLQRMCFGGKSLGRTFGTSTTAPPRLRIKDLAEEMEVAWHRLSDVTIENLDWKSCLGKYDRPHTLAYIDPPYLETAGYDGGPFGLAEWESLGEAVRGMKGKAIISSGDHPEIRRIFDGMKIQAVPITYHVGGQKNRPSRTELIIQSW